MTRPSSLGPHQQVVVPQGMVRYREAGDGPVIVFVHGLLVNGDLWRNVVPGLSGQFRCIVPDLPLGGHLPAMSVDADLTPPGLAQLVADFLATLNLDEVTLVGSDTGGGISQIAIANHPQRIARLVLTNCDAYEHFPPPLIAPFKWGAFVPGVVPAMAQLVRTVPAAGRLIYALVAHRDPGRAVLRGYFEPLARDRSVRRDVVKVLRGMSNRYTLQAAERFPEFRRPVLIVWGEDDLVFSWRDAVRLRRDFPFARLETVAGSRTFVSEDRPERLAESIASFMQTPVEAGLPAA